MTATAYTNQQEYIKYNQKKKHSDHDHGCDCHECKESKDCGCCPVGMIAIYDDKSLFIGCVTPNDAELYKKNIITCEEGFIKLIRNEDGEFMGCVSEENFHDIYVVINGSNS